MNALEFPGECTNPLSFNYSNSTCKLLLENLHFILFYPENFRNLELQEGF